MPIVELDGRILTQSYTSSRRFAWQLGKYDEETDNEKYWADAMCDSAIDYTIIDPYPFQPLQSIMRNADQGPTPFAGAFHDPKKDVLYLAVESRPKIKAFLESERYLG